MAMQSKVLSQQTSAHTAPVGQPERIQKTSSSAAPRTANVIQALLYKFLVDLVKTRSPEVVLEEFKRLFIHPISVDSSEPRQAVRDLIFANNADKFHSILKRSCYILINNWNTSRQSQAIQALVDLFQDPSIKSQTSSPTLRRLRGWLQQFINSKDYEELKLFAAKYQEEAPWNQRYASFLLTSQYADANNPLEQRKAAKVTARHLQEQYKFELAMYTARSQRRDVKSNMLHNPTELGDDVLKLVQRVLKKRGFFNLASLANIFVQQAQNISYAQFKHSLQKYLVFSMKDRGLGELISTKLADKLDGLYAERDRDKLDDALILRTCNRIIEFLTVERSGEPSQIFLSLLMQGNPLTLVMILLKLVLICKHARTHLETCIAKLIRYYEPYPEEECQGLIRFLEIYNVAFTIHAENVRYNLVEMPETGTRKRSRDNHRIFSQQESNKRRN